MPRADVWPPLLLAVLAAAVGLLAPGGWTRRLRPLTRPTVAAALVAIVSLATNAAVAALNGVPRIHVNDEYGYALIADTLAHGRLANPTPADAEAFASPHVLLRPTYASKYPPAQGVVMLVGNLLGHPAVGVWLSCAAAAVALWWMLLAFAPAEWALLGGLVAAVHPQMVEWGHVYWGGAVAVFGGAVVVGSWARLRRPPTEPGRVGPRPAESAARAGPVPPAAPRPPRETRAAPAPGRHGPALWLGLGLTVLANSRPYEGAILSLPLLVTLRWRLRPTIVLAVTLLIGGTLTATYNAAVTGHPLRFPIVAYAQQHDVAPKFWPLPLRTPTDAPVNDTLRWMHEKFEPAEHAQWQSLPGVVVRTFWLAVDVGWTFAQPGVLLVPLLFAVGLRRTWWLWVALAVFAVGLWVETFFLRHYAAPAAGVALTLTVLGWRRLHGWSPRLSRGLVVGYAVGATVAAAAVGRGLTNVGQQALPEAVPALRTGRHLVFVRYAPDHLPHDEWVYDGADPAGQRLLWVRSRTPADDRAVVRDYPGRRCWRMTVGRHDFGVDPYVP